MNTIKFAFALNQSDRFGLSHFGDADKYEIFSWHGNEMIGEGMLSNPYKNFDEQEKHGSEKKGEAISKLLRENGVKVLVSRQFGKNIAVVNKYFIPIIIEKETIAEVNKVLKKNIHWIYDEMNNQTKRYKLFILKKGVLKTIIKSDDFKE